MHSSPVPKTPISGWLSKNSTCILKRSGNDTFSESTLVMNSLGAFLRPHSRTERDQVFHDYEHVLSDHLGSSWLFKDSLCFCRIRWQLSIQSRQMSISKHYLCIHEDDSQSRGPIGLDSPSESSISINPQLSEIQWLHESRSTNQ